MINILKGRDSDIRKVFDRTAGKNDEVGTITELHVDPKDPTKVIGRMSISPSAKLKRDIEGKQPSYSYSYDPNWPEVTFIVQDKLMHLADPDLYHMVGRMPGIKTLVNNLRASKQRLAAELVAGAADLRAARLAANRRKKRARARTGRRS